ncbi:putative Molecular chaperone DnaJ [Azospirillaceae bacterium]
MHVQSSEAFFQVRPETNERWDEEFIYTIPCPSDFRASILDLHEKTGVDLTALIRMALNVTHADYFHSITDPGEPDSDDYVLMEEIGRSGGRRSFRSKPTLTVHYARGWRVSTLRHALAVALSLSTPPRTVAASSLRVEELEIVKEKLEQQLQDCRSTLEVLSFQLLPNGVKTQREAAHVMGFPNTIGLTSEDVTKRFRLLASVYHPDKGILGCAERLGQVVEARNILRRCVRATAE